MNKKSKYYIAKNTAIWALIATALCFIAYVLVLVAIWQKNSAVTYKFYVARDVLLVLFSVLATTLLTGFFIERRTKNELYSNTILHDVLANPVFYNEFSEETRQAMLSGLERELLFSGNPEIQGMYNSIKKKLSDVKHDGYYYEMCDYHVSCKVENNLIVKRVNRTIRLRSYTDRCSISNLLVLNWSGIKSIQDHFSLKSIKVNGSVIPSHQYQVKISEFPSDIESFCGYTVTYCYYLNDNISLYNDRDTVISVLYETRVPLSDNLYTCRTKVPCRRFEVSVILEDSPNYKLNAVAFGFLDTAKLSPDCVNDHEVRVRFDDWIFNKDGVTVGIAPKNQSCGSCGP